MKIFKKSVSKEKEVTAIKDILYELYPELKTKEEKQSVQEKAETETSSDENFESQHRIKPRLYPSSLIKLRWQSTKKKSDYYEFRLADISSGGMAFHLNDEKELQNLLRVTDEYVSSLKKGVIMLICAKQISIPIKKIEIRHISKRFKKVGCKVLLSGSAPDRLKKLLSQIRFTTEPQIFFESLQNNYPDYDMLLNKTFVDKPEQQPTDDKIREA